MPSEKLSEKVLGDPFECSGMWWLPNSSARSNSFDAKADERLYGTLKFVPEQGITLNTIGFFEGPLELLQTVSFKTDIVLGLSLEGETITLLNCTQIGATLGSINTSTLQVQSVLVGEHFSSFADLAFDAFSIQCTHLDDWMRVSGFHFSHSDETARKKEFSFSYKQPEETEVVVGKHKISIQAGFSFAGAGIFSKRVVAQQSNRFHVTPVNSEKITQEDGMELASSMQRFLSLMTMEPVSLQVVEGLILKAPSKTRLLYEPVAVRSQAKQSHPYDIPFPLEEIREDLGRLLDSFVSDQNLKPVYIHFFADFCSPSPYSEERFLSAISAIEAFHRRAFEQSELTNKNYYIKEVYPRFNALLDEMQLEAELANILRSRLFHVYEPTLQARLNYLLSDLGEPFVQVFVGANNVDQFIDTIVKTKDYLTTFSKDSEKIAAKAVDLAYLSKKLEVLFFTIVLTHIGMKKEVVREALAKQSESQFRKLGYLKDQPPH